MDASTGVAIKTYGCDYRRSKENIRVGTNVGKRVLLSISRLFLNKHVCHFAEEAFPILDNFKLFCRQESFVFQ